MKPIEGVIIDERLQNCLALHLFLDLMTFKFINFTNGPMAP